MKPIIKRQLTVSHNGTEITVKRMGNGYFCLNDMAQLFPKKEIRDFLKLKSTKKSIKYLSQPMGNSPYLHPLKTIKGKGTYASIELAIAFAMWCDITFKFAVIGAYIDSLGWEEKRELSVLGNSLMNEAINTVREEPKARHFSNEARLLNITIFGHHEKDIRNTATTAELELLNKLEAYNGALIMAGHDYQERKKMINLFVEKLNKN